MQKYGLKLLRADGILDENMRWKIERGSFIVQAAASSEDVKIEDRLYVKENAFVDGAQRSFYAKAEMEEIRRIYNFLISGIPKTNTVFKKCLLWVY